MRRGRPRKESAGAPIATAIPAVVPSGAAVAYRPPDRRDRTAERPPKLRVKGYLSDRQKAVICIWAARAAEVAGVKGYKEVEAWRRAEQKRRFNLDSLVFGLNSDYSRLKAHFERLAKQDGKAFNTHLREEFNFARQFRFLLDEALAEAGLSTGYAAAICRTQFKCDLDDASEVQLRMLLFTVKNRAWSKAHPGEKRPSKQSPAPEAPKPEEAEGDPF